MSRCICSRCGTEAPPEIVERAVATDEAGRAMEVRGIRHGGTTLVCPKCDNWMTRTESGLWVQVGDAERFKFELHGGQAFEDARRQINAAGGVAVAFLPEPGEPG